MRIIDMHCDTLIEGWRKPERSFYDGDTSINLKLLKENGSLLQFFAMYLSRNEMKTMDSYDILKGIYGYYQTQMEKYREYDKFTKCSKCELKAWCRGCPAVANGTSGNFYGTDPQCWKTKNEITGELLIVE